MTSTSPATAIKLKLICVLALLAATPPIATDLYLASFPEMATDLETDARHIQLTLTVFMAGIALGQLIWGPLSDRFGRLKPMLVGASIATVASLVCAMAPSVEILVGARFVQALGSAAVLVIGRAIITDLARGYGAAHAMSLMMTINSIAPVAAPVIGGFLSEQVSWRVVLGVVFALMAIQLISIVAVIRESHPVERRPRSLDYRPLLGVARRPAFVAYAATLGFSFGTLMAYITCSSFVYQNVLDLPSWGFGVGFGVNSMFILIGGAISTRRARAKIHPARTIRIGLPLMLGGAVGTLLCALSPWPLLMLLPLAAAVASAGLMNGNLSALAMQQTRDVSGAGSAVLGFTQFGVAGLASVLAALGGEHSAVPMGVAMTTSALIAVACFVLARRVVSPESEAVFDQPKSSEPVPESAR